MSISTSHLQDYIFFFFVEKLNARLYGRIVHSHLFCQSVFISPPIHPSIHPSVHLHTHPPTQAFGLVFSHLPILPLLSHSFLETTHLFTCPSIHPSIHPSILSKSSIRLPTHPAAPPPCLHVHGRVRASHLPTHLFTPRLSIQPFLHFFHLLPFLSTLCLSFSSVSVHPQIHSLTHHPSTLSFSQASEPPFTHLAIYPSTRPSVHAPTQPANVF